MPGDPVVEFAPNPEAERLVAAVDDLVASAPARFVLVGGLAVAARLETFHRATQDLDAVVAQERSRFQDRAIERVTSARVKAGNLTVRDVPVDVIDIDPAVTFDQIALLDEPIDRLFTAGHLFAYGDASSVELRCDAAHAVVEVATPRALFVTKLHAYLSARRDARKHPSDAIDLLELARLLIAPRAPGYTPAAPTVIREVCQWGVQQIAALPAEMVRRLGRLGVTVDANEVSRMMSLFVETVVT